MAGHRGALDAGTSVEELEQIVEVIPPEWLDPNATGTPEQCAPAVQCRSCVVGSSPRIARPWVVVAAVSLVVASACGSDAPVAEPPAPAETAPAEPEPPVVDEASEQAAEDVSDEEPSGIEDSADGASETPAVSEPDIEELDAEEPEPGEPEPEEPPAEEPAEEELGAPVQEVASVRLVSQNILHGVGCPADSDSCRVSERVSLFMDQLAQAECPELVSIQEANERIVGLVSAEAGACGYEVVWDDDPGLDREVVLTTLEVIDSRRRVLADRFRSAYLVRVASPVGVIDFLTTHLASSGDDRACSPGLCPPPCDAQGSLRTCQARQVLEFAEEVALDGAVTVLGGDLNDSAGSPTLAVFGEAGYVDSHLAAGHGECDQSSGAGCTAGREDTSLADMTDRSSLQSSRIDYLLYSAPGRDCSVGEGTGLFNAEPAASDLAFPSDHTGVALTLVCDIDGAESVDAAAAALTEAPDEPGPTDDQPVDEVTAQAITAAFETHLDGSIADIELRIDQVEEFAGMRDAGHRMFEAVGELGAAVRAEVDAISRTSATTARVVYSIILNDQVIFDGREGEAALIGGRWFVSRATFCDLAALSPIAETITVC